jgi:ribose 5-phosphate isomerase B
MRISIASDHGGLELKNHIITYLTSKGYEMVNFGTDTKDSCDYPDFAYKAASSVGKGEVDYGIVICTTGIGVSIVANKVKGVRCALVTKVEDAILTRQHNNTNCLAMGQKNVSNELGEQIVDAWLNTAFEGGRHTRRVEKISKIEE